MKKEAAIFRHPHYPEIIKFKMGSVKTISTLSNSNWEEDQNNLDKISLPGDAYHLHQDHLSIYGGLETDKGTHQNHSGSKRNSATA